MLIDVLDRTTVWATHTQADGSGIGGAPPLQHSIVGVPSDCVDWLLQTSGNSGGVNDYPAWMAYPATVRPVLPNTGLLSLEFDMFLGGNLTDMNVMETDTILVIYGFKYNGSVQYNKTQGFQIVDASGNWLNTGIKLPVILSQNNNLKITYAFNTAVRTMSVVSIAVDGVTHAVPTTLQNIPAQASTWLTGTYLQLQMGSMPSALAWQARIRDVRYTWS